MRASAVRWFGSAFEFRCVCGASQALERELPLSAWLGWAAAFASAHGRCRPKHKPRRRA